MKTRLILLVNLIAILVAQLVATESTPLLWQLLSNWHMNIPALLLLIYVVGYCLFNIVTSIAQYVSHRRLQ